jgi:hypothetical protein
VIRREDGWQSDDAETEEQRDRPAGVNSLPDQPDSGETRQHSIAKSLVRFGFKTISSVALIFSIRSTLLSIGSPT